MDQHLQELRTRLLEISDISGASALLTWDQATQMPPGGAAARGRQLATLARLAHSRLTDPAMGRLLEELRAVEDSLPSDSDDKALIRVARRDYEKAARVPTEFTAAQRRHAVASYHAWVKARPANDFASVRPHLEQTLDLSRQLAAFFPGYDHIADPLIDYSDYGVKAEELRSLFAQLRQRIVPLVKAITDQASVDDRCVRQHFPEPQQIEFGTDVIRRFGYDFERGRQDKTHHPFAIRFSIGDVRITTRFKEDDVREGLASAMHEAGHAMYEQGVNPAFEGTPLARGASSGVHESQSRLWENLVGRSRGFWNFFYPRLQSVFPTQLEAVDQDEFYRAFNKVERSLIRTDADEVTYNLHVMLRFDLELDLLEGRLAVKDLPEAWRERYRADLGIAPPDDRDGVLQDVHWFSGRIGGVFQGYTLGNILGAQFFDAALRAHPEIPAEIERGEFQTLHGWLRTNIYQHGRKYTANQLIQRVTGGPLSIEPYINYLTTKYGELYNISVSA